MNWNGSPQPTYVVRISGGVMSTHGWADLLAPTELNLTIEDSIGLWEGLIEHGTTFTIQGDEDLLDMLLGLIAEHDSEIQMVHVEEHSPRTAYVNVDERR